MKIDRLNVTNGKVKGTRNPRKRTKAVKRMYKSLNDLYQYAQGKPVKMSYSKYMEAKGIRVPFKWMRDRGLMRKQNGLYEWIGPEPSEAIAEDWYEHMMFRARISRNEDAPVPVEVAEGMKHVRTDEERADEELAMLSDIYMEMCEGVWKGTLSEAFASRGMSGKWGSFLLREGAIEKIGRSFYTWNGAPPDVGMYARGRESLLQYGRDCTTRQEESKQRMEAIEAEGKRNPEEHTAKCEKVGLIGDEALWTDDQDFLQDDSCWEEWTGYPV